MRSYRRQKVNESNVLPVSRAWTGLFHSWMRDKLEDLRPVERISADWSPVSLEPAGSRLSSFEIYWLVETTIDEPSSLLGALRTLSLADQDTPQATIQPWKNLLQVLSARGTTIEVTHFHGAESWTVRIDKDAAREKLQALPVQQITHVPSRLVPQANSLERLYRLVDMVEEGSPVTAESLDVAPRQVAYYFLAAPAIGILDEDRALTAAGRQVIRLAGADRHSLVAVLFETSRVGDAWIAWSQVKSIAEVDPTTATAFITECSRGLSGSTIPRRASTLETWASTLAPHHYSRKSRS